MTVNTVYAARTVLLGLVVFTLFPLSSFNSPERPCLSSSTADKTDLGRAVAEGPRHLRVSPTPKLTCGAVADRCRTGEGRARALQGGAAYWEVSEENQLLSHDRVAEGGSLKVLLLLETVLIVHTILTSAIVWF